MDNYNLATEPSTQKKSNDALLFGLGESNQSKSKNISVTLQSSSSVEKDLMTALVLHDQAYKIMRDSYHDVLVAKFNMLKTTWESETIFFSSVNDMAMHPAYQQIIGMGYDAVPLILNDMENAPKFWFWALTSITGEDPVALDQMGDMEEMTNEWLSWGKEKGYID